MIRVAGAGGAWRTLPAAMAWVAVAILALAPLTFAQDDGSYPERSAGLHVLDAKGVIPSVEEESVQQDLQGLLEDTGIDIVVLIQEKAPVGARRGARDDAEVLLAEWDVGGDGGTGAVMLWNVDREGKVVKNGIAVGDGFGLDDAEIEEIDESVNVVVQSGIRADDPIKALIDGVVQLQDRLADTAAIPRPTPTPAPRPGTTAAPQRPAVGTGTRPTDFLRPDPGPPFPDALDGVRVYDFARVISPDVVDRLGQTIATIEDRTGAQVVIYTQSDPDGNDAGRTERDAMALIDQWGVGRAGFDDGLAIFFNLTEDGCHGQVQLYAAPGFEASYLTNAERQAIFEDEMLPALRRCDFDTGLTAAMARIDEAATAEHAQALQLARQVDAVAGLVVAPLLLIGLVAWAGWSWLRYGRDPVYLDDPSILMPAPPPSMSPAAASVIMDGRARRRALTTAMVDLASRGEISFRGAEDDPAELDIDITVPDQRDARLARNRRQSLGAPEKYALDELRKLGGAIRTIDAKDVPKFAKAVGGFDDRLEDLVAQKGWFRESPGDAIERWSRRAAVVLIAGVVGVFFGFNLPSTGLLLAAAAAIAGSVAMFIIARTMPQRTMEGARMFAQLAAYRRTLQKTLEQSRTMDQVVASHVLPWVETPDQAVVWAYALGLHEEAEEVLERSMADVRTGAASPTRTYFPLWYSIGARSGARISGGARAPTAGLFSSGVVPDFMAMTAALSTIGSPPASSGGGGGFGGGGSGGGGGGAGGGF